MTFGARRDEPVLSLTALVRDDDAFRAWYDRVLPRVYGFLLQRCNGDRHLAEELTQQTFVEAVRRRSQFDGRSDVVTWLCAIGRNKLIDYHRRIDRDHRRQLRLVDGWSGAHDDVWPDGDVQAALAAIGAEQRLVLLLRHLDGYAVREIAAAIGRSESATDTFLVRAREAFRRAYRGHSDA